LEGGFAEMETGEGKTLTAAVAALLLAMGGVPVHVLTANDYLAERDAAFARGLLAPLGFRVAYVAAGMAEADRRAAYAADVTYGAAKEVAFDYLRDRLALGTAGHARLRAAALQGAGGRRGQLVMRGLGACIVDEADSILVDEARTPLILSRDTDGALEADVCRDALTIARDLTVDVDYELDRPGQRVTLTETGVERIGEAADGLSGVWRVAPHRRDLVTKALSALHLFRRDEHYLVTDDGVQIIDEYTGRTMPDRFWNDGLHQMIEVKEGCAVSGLRTPLLRLTYQRFFRRYRHLSGMSGTVLEVAPELYQVYRAHVLDLPTHRPRQRRQAPSRLFPDKAAKWAWVVRRTTALIGAGRPVLIGVRTVEAAREAHAALTAAGLAAQLLSAAQDAEEAAVVARAGEPGTVTVATNMAGRGTDIKLRRGVVEAGGLHVIVAERHQSRRIDRQLAGRCGRQGDPGSFEICVSLQDDLVPAVAKAGLMTVVPGRDRIRLWLVDRAQAALERRHGRVRSDLVRQDDKLGSLLAFAGEEL
jgi:preprotein translocase subunit SecA